MAIAGARHREPADRGLHRPVDRVELEPDAQRAQRGDLVRRGPQGAVVVLEHLRPAEPVGLHQRPVAVVRPPHERERRRQLAQQRLRVLGERAAERGQLAVRRRRAVPAGGHDARHADRVVDGERAPARRRVGGTARASPRPAARGTRSRRRRRRAWSREAARRTAARAPAAASARPRPDRAGLPPASPAATSRRSARRLTVCGTAGPTPRVRIRTTQDPGQRDGSGTAPGGRLPAMNPSLLHITHATAVRDEENRRRRLRRR